MSPTPFPPTGLRRRRQAGQTIVVALIILGLLLILGLVFLGIVNRAIVGGTRQSQRNATNDLAEAGVRYAHQQMLTSEDGADWRGTPTEPLGNGVTSRDPDALYLRPASGFNFPGTTRLDLGGPDGLGRYVRIGFQNGRALVRVRYAPSDANLFAANPEGAIRNPGQLRNLLVVESVGRTGTFDTADPTTLRAGTPVQYRNFASQAQFDAGLAALRDAERQNAPDRVVRALVPIGITETARFITNKFRVSRPAEIGVPPDLGVSFPNGAGAIQAVAPSLSLQLGLPQMDTLAGSPTNGIGGFGSLHSNADLTIYGRVTAYANAFLGDAITVAGSVRGAPGSAVDFNAFRYDRAAGTWSATALTYGDADLDSRGSFNTNGGLFRDNGAGVDAGGAPRDVGYKTPPSLLAEDPATKQNRYVFMTRESGVTAGNGNSGRFGHGRGVYVDNGGDRQTALSEAGRQSTGARSLLDDWLNPNNPDSQNWYGPFYIPRGASLFLTADGFTVVRDPRGEPNQRFWRAPDGSLTNLTALRFRLGRGSDGLVRIVNALTPGLAPIEGALVAAEYDRGPVFNGVLTFQGNVRVRGVIPTDVPMSVVSLGTIYIEGSVTKGVTPNDVSGAGGNQTRLTRPSRSLLALMARDYVAVNTTMFFGPVPRQSVESVADAPGAGWSPVRMRSDATLTLQGEFALAPPVVGGNPLDPSTWTPLAAQYTDPVQTSTRLVSSLLLTHTSADQAADRTFFGLSVNRGPFDTPTVVSPYLFPYTDQNAASSSYPGPGNIPVYGLGVEGWQRAPKYEQTAFPLIDPNALTMTTAGADLMVSTAASGNYRLFSQGINELEIRPAFLPNQQWNDYYLARAAVAPHDVRIEALIFAEEGSFFVIPGSWFNPNPNDTRAAFATRVIAAGTGPDAVAIAEDGRLRDFGASPEVPFYGEPLDVRILVSGAISENMPPALGQQAEWLRKWGWIPGQRGTVGRIPAQHGYQAIPNLAPNLIVSFDPVIGTGRVNGFAGANDPNSLVRVDDDGRALPPLPRLPVSPALAYFGDLNNP